MSSSDFWHYDDERTIGWWHFKWDSQESKKELLKNLREFGSSYVDIVEKYKILVPFHEIDINDVLNHSKFNLNRFYYKEKTKELIYPSVLFKGKGKEICKELVSNIDVSSSEPVYIWNRFFHDEINLPYIYIQICNDVFFEHLQNDKTWRSDDLKLKNKGIDNSNLAYLNTPRLNSFFRDLKELCINYGAKFSFESYGFDEWVSEDGIFIDREIVYYEDIVDILEDKYKIVT
ncbi:hypothetical protein [uncultured Tenacibaculum sp.]|uniref:hypothetical protein n=1 Tax=uncultured Tenacibaculum sp. TaxID=174713 RepID=UPI002614BBA0|nr:hypothetical protein [uncultured Tenacibaculum sp.]